MIRPISSQAGTFGLAHAAIDLTPVLDVIFMLLVFFMLTANPVEHVFSIDLPKMENNRAETFTSHKTMTLTIFPYSEHWEINGTTLSDWNAVKRMMTQLQTQYKHVEYLIAADRQVSIEKLLHVLDFFKARDIAVANILIQPQSSKHTNR